MAALAQPAMLVSFIEYMPRQCLRQSLPVATQCAVASSRALYFGGCIMGSSAIFIMGSSPVCAKACEAEDTTATVPAAAINSRRSIIDFLPLVQRSDHEAFCHDRCPRQDDVAARGARSP